MKKFLALSSFVSSLMATESLLSLQLEDLTQVTLASTSATLSKTPLRDTPASTTIINHEQILQSGARNLDELLEIYVPSFTYMYKIQGNQIGLRGIISDRNNKILLLVNGKNMNIKAADGGAITEQWFSLLGDIKKVTVIRGSGSTIYGPGAIAGIINIETFSGNTFEGVAMSARGGVAEEFASVELNIGDTLSSGMKYYIYYGIDTYKGASQSKAPEKFSFDKNFSNPRYPSIVQDNAIGFPTTNNHASFESTPRQKFHAQLDGANFSLWLRYTYSSEEVSTNQNTIVRYADFGRADWLENTGFENQQITIAGSYKQNISSSLQLKYNLSYMLSDVNILYSRNPLETRNKSWGENNLNAKVTAHYTYSADNIFTFGAEYDYNQFGRRSFLNSSQSTIAGLTATPGVTWDASMYSLFGEYKHTFSADTLFFLNLRADKHSYTDMMYSPRLSLIHHLNAENTIKFIASRSVRHSDDAELYSAEINHDNRDTEKLTSYEIIYDYAQESLTCSLSPYYNIHDIVAFNDSNFKTENIGQTKSVGFEAELHYEYSKKLHFEISHAYNKLLDFSLYDLNIQRQNISAQPYGYGDDFANWNNHITKLQVNYDFNKKLHWMTSMQIFWGIDGAMDMSEYNAQDLAYTFVSNPSLEYKLPVLDTSKAVEEHIYLNTGLSYKANKKTLLTLNAYNLMGLFDERYNIRNYFLRTSHYREMTPSVACRLNYKF